MTDKIEITPKFLADLKAKAEKAMPGPWELDETPTDIATYYEIYSTDWMVADCEKDGASAAYIAAANPAVVLALIEKIKRLEEDFDAAARSAADESVKAVKLEEEADWLAQQASLMCDCIENCDECRLFSECGCNGANSKEIWRKAAQEAISQEEARIKESEPDA